MTLFTKLTQDLNKALKEKDKIAISIIRFLISKLHNAKIAKGQELEDDEIIAEIAKEIKRHKESIEAFEKGKRDDLVEREKAELAILERYLPRQLSSDEIAKIVEQEIAAAPASGPADIGKVIGQVMGKVKGQADGAVVARIVRERLGG